MDDLNAFERQIASQLNGFVGPVRPVNDAAIFTAITATRSPKWRFQSGFSATKFVVAGAIVALFGGLLLVAQPFGRVAVNVPGAEGLPPVTGPAGNGLMAFARDGGIVVGDPATGETEVIVTDERSFRPLFSPDGTHIAFLRLLGHSPEASCDLAVVRADGSDERDITPEDGPVSCIGTFLWAPDGRSIVIIGYNRESPLLLLDASGAADPVVLPMNEEPPIVAPILLRPPDGDRLLIWGGAPALGIVDLDGSDVVDLGGPSGLEAMGYEGFVDPGWSPDGTRIAVLASAGHERHLYVMDPDGSELRRLAAIPWHEHWGGPPWSWSPDGSKIAVQYATLVDPSSRDSCWNDGAGIDHCGGSVWVTLIDVESGRERVLDATYSPYEGDGALIDWSWSPDGRAILLTRERSAGLELVDIATDTSIELPRERDGLPLPSWQRVAAD